MNDKTSSDNDSAKGKERQSGRVFLVVVDDTEEMQVALRFACMRAKNTGGRVALLYVVEPADFQHFASIGDLMREEARSEGERILQELAQEVNRLTGTIPVLYVREGEEREQLFKLIDEEPRISILVLGAATSSRGPGPLVSALTGKFVGKLRVPITIVPGNLKDSEIDSIS
jgi:nucleotide-binding universal stress UspA family protein